MTVENIVGSLTSPEYVDLCSKLAGIGAVNQEQITAAVKEILLDVADAEAATEPDMYKLAAKHADAYIANKKGAGAAGGNTTQTDGSLPDENNEALTRAAKKFLSDYESLRLHNSQHAVISKLVLEKEPYLPGDISAEIQVQQPKKMAEYQSKLVNTKENMEAFNALKELVGKMAPTHMPADNKKVVGFIGAICTEIGALPAEKAYTKDEMIAELVFRCYAAIDNPDSIRIALTHVAPKGGSKENGVGKGVTNEAVETTPRITIKGKKDILDNVTEKKYVYANLRSTDANDTSEKTLKTEASFQINTTRKDKDGKMKPVKQTVRFSGKGKVLNHMKNTTDPLLTKFSAVGSKDKAINFENTSEVKKLKDEATQSIAYLLKDKTAIGELLNEIQLMADQEGQGAANMD